MRKHEIHKPVTRDGKRQFTVWQKRLILREHVEQGISISLLARKYQIHPVTIYGWKRSVDLAGEHKDPHASIDELLAELERLQKENHRLKISIGDLTVEKTCQQEIIESLKKDPTMRSWRSGRRGYRQRPVHPTSLPDPRSVATGLLQGAATTRRATDEALHSPSG